MENPTAPAPQAKASNETKPKSSTRRRRPKITLGVEVTCKGERENGCFAQVEVNLKDAIYTKEREWCYSSCYMGIPLLVRKCATSNTLAAKDKVNPIASKLMSFTFDQKPLCGWNWKGEIGTLVFVRRDKKPLAVNHLMAMWMFSECYYDWFDALGEAPEFELPFFWDAGYVSPYKTRFQDFWIDYQQEEAKEEEKQGISDWSITPNPFDI